LETKPALFVRGTEDWWPVFDESIRQYEAFALGQLQQRGVPHRTGEVQMQMCLGQATKIAPNRRCGRHCSGEEFLHARDAFDQIGIAEGVGQSQVAR
jgi:hypothetical protein